MENRAYLGCWPGAYDGAALVSFNDSLGHDYYRFYYNFPVRPRAIIEPPAQDPKRAEGLE